MQIQVQHLKFVSSSEIINNLSSCTPDMVRFGLHPLIFQERKPFLSNAR